MRNLTPKTYDEIRFNKYIYYANTSPPYPKNGREIIHQNIIQIKSRFVNYQDNKHQLENVGNSPINKSDDDNSLYKKMYKLYGNKTLKESIRKISGMKCPYCGIQGLPPNNIDHFIPRGDYPEFSVHPENLIAVCYICNVIYKRDIFLVSGVRQFMNPYFDQFISLDFLVCNISVDRVYPKIEFIIDPALQSTNQYGYQIISNHFKNLNLYERFKNNVIEIFTNFKRQYFENKQPMTVSKIELINDIEKRIRGLDEEGINNNNHEKKFWESLKQCNVLLNLIVDQQLPFN